MARKKTNVKTEVQQDVEPIVSFMLVGQPASGKSTWAKEFVAKNPAFVILSTDDYIENYAKSVGKTYDDVFDEVIKDAERNLQEQLEICIDEHKPFIYDQTNLSVKSRARKLAKIPSEKYVMIAKVFQVSEEVLVERLNKRVGKIIPHNVLDTMKKSFAVPTVEEGFEQILF